MPEKTVPPDPLRFIAYATKEKVPTFRGLIDTFSSGRNSTFVEIENGVGNFRVYLDRTFKIYGSSAYSKTIQPGTGTFDLSDPVSSAKPSYVWSVALFLMWEDPYRSISAMLGKKNPELSDVMEFVNGNRSSIMSFRFSSEPRLKWAAVISDEFGKKYEILHEGGDWAGYVPWKPLSEQNPDALRILVRMMTVPQREDARMADFKESSPKIWKFYRKFVEEARKAGLPFHYPETDGTAYLRFNADSYHVSLSGSDKYGGLPVVDSVFQKGSRVESAISSMFRPVFKREFLQWNDGLAEKKVFDPGPDGGWWIERAWLDIWGMSRYPDKW